MSDDITTTKLGVEPDNRFASLRRALGVTSFGINQIVMGPGERNRIHRHRNQEEVYVVLEGTLTLVIEGEPHDGEAFADWADTEPGTPQTLPAPEDLPPSELIG
jgi:oxalate decarboxylase/phosphoglucose isomerase-like protein (cupin superfamily)